MPEVLHPHIPSSAQCFAWLVNFEVQTMPPNGDFSTTTPAPTLTVVPTALSVSIQVRYTILLVFELEEYAALRRIR